MIEHLEIQLLDDSVKFVPSGVRLRCMPHTVHLAVMEVLENQLRELHL